MKKIKIELSSGTYSVMTLVSDSIDIENEIEKFKSSLEVGISILNYYEISDLTEEELKQSKNYKIKQLKENRDEANIKLLDSQKAPEVVDNGDGSFTTSTDLKYFSFRTERTSTPLTSPSNIINSALRGNNIRYSCSINEGKQKRKGYVEIDSNIAQSLEQHLMVRAQSNIAFANLKEDEINTCSTVEEVEAIDINFN
jgi:hypothetical protein